MSHDNKSVSGRLLRDLSYYFQLLLHVVDVGQLAFNMMVNKSVGFLLDYNCLCFHIFFVLKFCCIFSRKVYSTVSILLSVDLKALDFQNLNAFQWIQGVCKIFWKIKYIPSVWTCQWPLGKKFFVPLYVKLKTKACLSLLY